MAVSGLVVALLVQVARVVVVTLGRQVRQTLAAVVVETLLLELDRVAAAA